VNSDKLLHFKTDTKHRKDWFTGISFSHPAKMSLPLQLWIIENYTKAGETILDPMSGSGTVLVACSMGRNVIAVELEQKFVDMMNKNWEKIRQRGAQLGYEVGWCKIIQGDARQLEAILCNVKQSDIVMATIAELIDPELLAKLEELKAELERIENDAKKENKPNTEKLLR